MHIRIIGNILFKKQIKQKNSTMLAIVLFLYIIYFSICDPLTVHAILF